MPVINGRPQDTLDIYDRGLQFGDGCFTTARIIDGHIRLLTDHLVRLRRDAWRLHIGPLSWSGLKHEMQALAAEVERGVLKVMITRGSGGRGYALPQAALPNRILSLASWPEHYSALAVQGIRLTTSPVTLGKNPWLAGIKHLNRLEQVLIRRQLDQTAGQEALVLDSTKTVVECCAANLFWRKDDTVFTPDLTQCGVQGTMRRHILRQLRRAAITVHIVRAERETLMAADEVVVCNALMPVLPVVAIDDQHYSQRQLFNFLAPRCE